MRFTLDEWMIRLHPGLAYDSEEYGAHVGEVRELIWSVAEQVLRAGTDVVLDWNCWSVERRRWATQRAGEVGAPVTLHRLDVPVATASARVRARTRAGADLAHPVTRQDIEHLATLLEEPTAQEGFEIVEH